MTLLHHVSLVTASEASRQEVKKGGLTVKSTGMSSLDIPVDLTKTTLISPGCNSTEQRSSKRVANGETI